MTDFFIIAAEGDAERVEALAAALRPEFSVFASTEVEPGDDAGAVLEREQQSALATLVLVSPKTREDLTCAEAVQRGIAAGREDPRGHRVVPIVISDRVGRRELPYGLIRQGDAKWVIQERLPALIEALRRMHRARLAEVAAQPVSIAVLAVLDELGEAADHLVQGFDLLKDVATVRRVDAEEPGEWSADFVVGLVGLRTGGSDALAAACGSDAAVVLRRSVSDPRAMGRAMRARPDETNAALELHERIGAEFDTPADALRLARAAFNGWLTARRPAARPGGSSLLEPWEREYLTVRLKRWRNGRNQALLAMVKERTHVREQLYVSLRAEVADAALVDGELALTADRAHGREGPGAEGQGEELEALAGRIGQSGKAVPLELLPGHDLLPALVIEGPAGSGKTVLLQHVASILAMAVLDAPELADIAHEVPLAALEWAPTRVPVPLTVEARQLAACSPDGKGDGLSGLVAALLSEVSQAIDPTVAPTPAALRQGLEAGRYMLLVDSLDEVPSREGRRCVLDGLAAAAESFSGCRFVLTTRPAPYTGLDISPPLRRVRIAELDDGLARNLMARWCAAQHEDGTYQEAMAGALFEAAQRLGRATFTRNPLLLTAAVLVYAHEQQLPDDTVALYEKMVTLLCGLKAGDTSADERLEALERIAEATQRTGTTALPVEAAAQALRRWRSEHFKTLDAAEQHLDQLSNDTGLLYFEAGEHGRQVVRPWHRSFQEFLAARRCAAGGGSVAEKTRQLVVAGQHSAPDQQHPARPEALREEWEHVLRFLVGVYGRRGAEEARACVETLHAAAADLDGGPHAARAGRLLGLVGAGLNEYGRHFEGHELVAALPGEIVARFQAGGEEWPEQDRILALEQLGRLGDPRLREDPWVMLPGGTFVMGGDEQAFDSAARHEVRLDAFAIARYPVTVDQYAAFVASGGYEEPGFWRDVEPQPSIAELSRWRAQGFHPNRPVIGVCWHEAMAYARWVSESAEGRRLWHVQDGRRADLPTEAEWERAGRGLKGRSFPWGEEDPDATRANFESRLGEASPVGAYPAGASADGVRDLGGNVWEWCLDAWRSSDAMGAAATEHDNPCHRGDSLAALRVVRGGGWDVGPGGLRSACRLGLEPGGRGGSLGFRLVCRVPRQLDR